MKKALLLCAAFAAALASARDTNRHDRVYADANGTVYAQRGGLGTSNYVVTAVSPGDMFRALADGTSPDRGEFGTAVNSVVLVPPQDFRATSLTRQNEFFDDLATNKAPASTAAFSNAVVRFSPPADFSPGNADLVETIANKAGSMGFVKASGDRMTGNLVVSTTPEMGTGSDRYVRVDYHGGADTATKYGAGQVSVNWNANFPGHETEDDTWYIIYWPYEKTGTVLLDSDYIPWSRVSGRPAIPSYSDVTGVVEHVAESLPSYSDVTGIVENATADLASDMITDATNWIVRADRTVWSIVDVPVKTNDYFVVDSFESSVASPGAALARELSCLRESVGDRLDYQYYLPGRPRYCNSDTNAHFGGIHYFVAGQPEGWLIMGGGTASPPWTENPDTSMHAFADGDVFVFTNRSVSAFQGTYGDLYVTLTYHYGVEPARVDTNYVGRLVTDSETGGFAWLADGTVLETRDGVKVLPSHIGAVSNDSAFAEYVSMSENSVQHDPAYQNVSNRAVNAVQTSAAFATATNRAMTAVQPGAAFATATNRAMTAMQPGYEDASGNTLKELMDWKDGDDNTLYDLMEHKNGLVTWDDGPVTWDDDDALYYFELAGTAVQPGDLRTAKVALANVTNSAGRAVSAGDVGAVSNVIVSVMGQGYSNEVTYKAYFTNEWGAVRLVLEEAPTGSDAQAYPYKVRLVLDRNMIEQNWRTGDPASPASDLTSTISLGPMYNGFGVSAYDPVNGRNCTVMLHPESASGYFMVEDWNSFSRGLSATAAAAETNSACRACVGDSFAAMGVALSTNVADTVTNTVRDLSLGGIWDEDLEVWWTPQMKNGSLTYVATTNVNLNAGD